MVWIRTGTLDPLQVDIPPVGNGEPDCVCHLQGSGRHDDLVCRGGRAHPGGAMHAQTPVVTSIDGGLVGVNPDPYRGGVTLVT